MTDTTAPPVANPAPSPEPPVGRIDTPVPPELAAAVVAAWAELERVRKDQTAVIPGKDGKAGYSYKFADLADVVEMARPVLARHGLALIQPVSRRIGRPVEVETWLLHTSGHLLRWVFETSGDGGPQALGSAITYARRYCGQAALGIAPDDSDDDGAAAQAAVTPPRQTRPKAAPKKAPARPAPDGPRKAADPVTAKAMILFGRLGYGARDDRLRLTSEILERPVSTWSDTTGAERDVVIDELERRERQEAEMADDTEGRAARRDDREGGS